MPRVLVIDDQRHVRAAITVALRVRGFHVSAFESGRLRLIELDREDFDLAIIDIVMPEMDGVKVIRSLHERRPDLAVIAISGASQPSSGRPMIDVLRAADDLSHVVRLKKPFRADELMRATQVALASRLG